MISSGLICPDSALKKTDHMGTFDFVPKVIMALDLLAWLVA
jgi:hypothetical protein